MAENTTSSSTPCRWGILGTAGIARKVVRAMHAADNAHPVLMGSRTLEKAEAFAAEHRVDRGCGSYEDVLSDPDIDAVYIPLPTMLHREWTIKAAEAGKHVLCEKPVAPTAEDARAMTDACAAAGVQFMDGVMFMHHARLNKLRDALPKIGGRPTSMMSVHSFKAHEGFFETNIRVNPDTEPLGCVGDLVWYNVRFSLFAMQYEMPVRVRAAFQATHDDVPVQATAEIEFADGTVSVMQSSFVEPTRQWFEITGPAGTITLRDFVHGPPDESTFDLDIGTTLNSTATAIEYQRSTESTRNCAQEVEMVRKLSAIATNQESVDEEWSKIAVQTQQVVDAIMASARQGGQAVDVG